MRKEATVGTGKRHDAIAREMIWMAPNLLIRLLVKHTTIIPLFRLQLYSSNQLNDVTNLDKLYFHSR